MSVKRGEKEEGREKQQIGAGRERVGEKKN